MRIKKAIAMEEIGVKILNRKREKRSMISQGTNENALEMEKKVEILCKHNCGKMVAKHTICQCILIRFKLIHTAFACIFDEYIQLI